MKSKQELIDKWKSAIESAKFYGKGKEERLVSYMKDFVSDLKQIEEPEVLSQEWIDEHAKAVAYDGMPDETEVVYVDDLQNLLVPKQELPVIPSFVAEWIEGNRQFEEKWNDYSKEDAMNDTIHFTVYGLFADYPDTNSHVELRKPVLKWLSVDRGNYFKLVNAVRYGYEVEEEKQYYARIKGWGLFVDFVGTKYWGVVSSSGRLGFVSIDGAKERTKEEWNNLGINEDNADFVLVEELEENGKD